MPNKSNILMPLRRIFSRNLSHNGDEYSVPHGLSALQNMVTTLHTDSNNGKKIQNLQLLSSAINEMPADKISMKILVKIFYSLHVYDSNDRDVNDLIRIVCNKIKHFPKLSPFHVATSLFSLRSINKTPEILDAIELFAKKISDSDDTYDLSYIGRSLSILNNISSPSHKSAIYLVSTLTDKLQALDAYISNRDLPLLLYGLRKMNVNDPIVTKFISLLLTKLEDNNATDNINLTDLHSLAFSLMEFDSNNVHVRKLINRLAIIIQENTNNWNEKFIGDMLRNIKNMNVEHSEVRTLISEIALKIYKSNCVLSRQGLYRIVTSLQFIRSTSTNEIKDLIKSVCKLIRLTNASNDVINNCVLNGKEISQCYTVLRHMSTQHNCTRVLYHELYPSLQRTASKFSLEAINVAYILNATRHINCEFNGVRETTSLLAALTGVGFGLTSRQKKYERKLPGVQESKEEAISNVQKPMKFDNKSLAMAFSGLKCMHGNFEPSQELLKSLCLHASVVVKESPLSFHDISFILSGLGGFNNLTASLGGTYVNELLMTLAHSLQALYDAAVDRKSVV